MHQFAERNIRAVSFRPHPHVSVSFENATFFLHFQKKFASTRSVFRSFSPVRTKTLKRKYCWGCMRVYHAMWSHFIFPNYAQCLNMSQSGKPVKGTGKDDDVERLVKVTSEHKVAMTSENVDWESCQTKYSEILDLFCVQYLTPEEIVGTKALHVLLAS